MLVWAAHAATSPLFHHPLALVTCLPPVDSAGLSPTFFCLVHLPTKIHFPYSRNNCADKSFGLALHQITQDLSLWSSVRHFSWSSGRRLSYRITRRPCWGPQKDLDGRPAPSKNGAAVIVDSPTTTFAWKIDFSARRMHHVGDLYPLASSIV
jgi:hypothetical protein